MSERERKREKMVKQSESTKKSQLKTKSPLSEKLPQQSSLQPSPLAVKTSSRPTSSSSSRSAQARKLKDDSSKKQHESLLNTKVYSASQPNVADTAEMRNRSGSDSSRVSVSSRKSDSAVQKKRKVSAQKKVAKGNTAKSLQKSSTHSVHSDVATANSNGQVNQNRSPTPAAMVTEADGLLSSSESKKDVQPTPSLEISEGIDIGATNQVTQDQETDSVVEQVPSETIVADSTSFLVQPVEDKVEEQIASANATAEDTEENQTDGSPKPTGTVNKSENQDTTAELEDLEMSKKSAITSPSVGDELHPLTLDDAIHDRKSDSHTGESVEGHGKSDDALNETSADSPNLERKDEVSPIIDATAKGELIKHSIPNLSSSDQTGDVTASNIEGSSVPTESVIRDKIPSDLTSPENVDERNVTADVAKIDGSTAVLSTLDENNADPTVDYEDKKNSNTKSVPEDMTNDEIVPVGDTILNNEVHSDKEIAAKDDDDLISDSATKDDADIVTEEVIEDTSHPKLVATNEDQMEQTPESVVKDTSAPASQVEIQKEQEPGIDSATKVESEAAVDAVVRSEPDLGAETLKSASDPADDAIINNGSDPDQENASKSNIDTTSNAAIKSDTDASSVPEEIVGSDSTTVQSDSTSHSNLQDAPQPHGVTLPEKTDSKTSLSSEKMPGEIVEEKVEVLADKESQHESTSPHESHQEKLADENGGQELSDMTKSTSEHTSAPTDKVQMTTGVGLSTGDNNTLVLSSQVPETVNTVQESSTASVEDPQPESQEKPTESETEVSGNETSEEIQKSASTLQFNNATAMPESSERNQESTNTSPDDAANVSSNVPHQDSLQPEQLEVSGEDPVPEVACNNELPEESEVANTELVPTDTESQSEVLLKPEQSEQESIPEHLNESRSQEEGSTATSAEVKDHKANRIKAITDGYDSSVTETDIASDVLTPVTDDADVSMESAAETDSSLPPSSKMVPHISSVVQPTTTEPEQFKEGTVGSIKEEEADELEKISDVSSTITSTTAEESKESET